MRVDEVKCGLSSHRFDAARAGGDRHFSDDLDEPDFSRSADVSTATELAAISADINDANNATVFVAEERQCAFGLFVELCFVRGHRRVIDDLLIYELLDLPELGMSHGFEMGEIEPHAIRGFRSAGLAHVRAEGFAQGPVNQVSGGMMARDGASTNEIDRQFRRG